METEQKQIRLYVKGSKVFANFDADAFLSVLNTRLPELEGACVNQVIEHAMSAATGNVDEDGSPLRVARFDWLARGVEAGLTCTEKTARR